MPTGYTAAVADGAITDLPTFALQCARNFGALILMRDEPMDAPIPDAFEPSYFYERELSAIRERLARLEAMSPEEADNACEQAYLESVTTWERRAAERAETKGRYEAMLALVQQWTPPTQDHTGLKVFMLDQLRDSIKFDCDGSYDERPVRMDSAAWVKQQIEAAKRRFESYSEGAAEERERTNSRNAWIAKLRESLSATPAMGK